MKKILSGLVILIMTVMIASTAFGTAHITGITNDGGSPIESSTPGSTIRVVGNAFGNYQWFKVLVMEFTTPAAFSIDLEVLDWSNSNIQAKIPASIMSHMSGESIRGQIKIVRTSVLSDERETISDSYGFNIDPIEFKALPGKVVGMPSGGDERDIEAAPTHTVMHKDEPLSVQMPRQEVRGTLGGETTIEMKRPDYQAIQPAEITRVVPDVASPGEEIRIEGRYFYSQGDRIVSIYFVHPTVTRSFYMDLEVIGWDENGIFARIPNLDQKVFRFSTPITTKKGLSAWFSSRPANVPYDTYEYLPPEIMRQLSTYTDGQIRIISFPDTLISNTKSFRLAPGD